MRNKELFYKIAEVIENNPNCRSQKEWVDPNCKTRFCIARYAVILSGKVEIGGGMGSNYTETYDGSWILDIAQKELGIAAAERYDLFYALDLKDGETVPNFLRRFADKEEVK